MARRKQTRGKCVYCGREMARSGLISHLPACSARQEAIVEADRGRGRAQAIYHLVVRDAWQGMYWLHLEMNGTEELGSLDTYLRAIWLECCDHLSEFSIGGWGGEKISDARPAQSVFAPGVELTHIYDFGTSSYTLVKYVGQREGRPLTRHPIALMARNDPPQWSCVECGQPATWWCMECVNDKDEPGWLCDEHAEVHPHDDYGPPMAIVNSPRIGMCGYDGPAPPPY